jgi:hypothetical protein
MSQTNQKKDKEPVSDENLGIMIYGFVKIKDVETGKILVNQRT